LTVVIEIPGGSRNKYELDHQTGQIYLDRMLFTATRYPADYGFIEGTLGGDGDPLDALVFVGEPTFPGCRIQVRPVGVFVMRDAKGMGEGPLCAGSHMVARAGPLRPAPDALADRHLHRHRSGDDHRTDSPRCETASTISGRREPPGTGSAFVTNSWPGAFLVQYRSSAQARRGCGAPPNACCALRTRASQPFALFTRSAWARRGGAGTRARR
jgi:hypothetical protein